MIHLPSDIRTVSHFENIYFQSEHNIIASSATCEPENGRDVNQKDSHIRSHQKIPEYTAKVCVIQLQNDMKGQERTLSKGLLVCKRWSRKVYQY